MNKYPPHALEMHTPEPKITSEKTIFLDPTKYKFNKETKETKMPLWQKIIKWKK